MKKQFTTLVLGARASRSVKYDSERPMMPSPLDSDFFELLQRIRPKKGSKDAAAVESLIRAVLNYTDEPLWNSMEKMFYTLHLRAVMRETLFPKSGGPSISEKLVSDFTRGVQALLRAAHMTNTSEHHVGLFQRLRPGDAIITFNYDLVPERALKQNLENTTEFGSWLYGFNGETDSVSEDLPRLYKLHGSVNWKADREARIIVKQKAWQDFDAKPGYTGDPFSILLPFWDKKVEVSPWQAIWRKAAAHLRRTRGLIIWGYLLPLTDLKARELFRLSLRSEAPLKSVCVIDPAPEVRNRWRAAFIKQEFRQYPNIDEFLEALKQEGTHGGGFQSAAS